MMNHIYPVSRYMLLIVNLLIILLPLTTLTLWWFIDCEPITTWVALGALFEPIQAPEGLMNLSQVSWAPLSKFLGFLSSLAAQLPLLWGLARLKKLFKAYMQGHIFIAANAHIYRHLGFCYLASGLITTPLAGMLLTLAVTIANPPGHRYISLSIGTPNALALFVGFFVIIISWIMREASKIHDEQKLTI